MEDPAVIAEECSEHPTAAAAASNDNPFNNDDNYDEDWEDHGGNVKEATITITAMHHLLPKHAIQFTEDSEII